jgi:hypothetical protein
LRHVVEGVGSSDNIFNGPSTSDAGKQSASAAVTIILKVPEGALIAALPVLAEEFLATEATAAAVAGREAKDVTYLYQKVGAAGEHLKFGITNDPIGRYTKAELAGGRLRLLARGARDDMLQLERNLHETLPIGPEEAQKCYINIQIQKGLKPPPYK